MLPVSTNTRAEAGTESPSDNWLIQTDSKQSTNSAISHSKRNGPLNTIYPASKLREGEYRQDRTLDKRRQPSTGELSLALWLDGQRLVPESHVVPAALLIIFCLIPALSPLIVL